MTSEKDLERSLLQKAVRRGDAELTGKVIKYLKSVGDDAWLKRRLYIITYEECWPIATQINPDKLYESYTALALIVKNKNAAGLAALAERFITNGNSVLRGNDADIIDVADAITNPVRFWQNTKTRPYYNASFAEASQNAITKATFPGDKAMILAAVHLSSVYPIPETETVQANNNPDFPYWVAIDKHTTIGKNVYDEACRELNINGYAGLQLGFYFESARCNQIAHSPIWEQQKFLELERLGYTMDSAQETWLRLRPIVIKKTQSEAQSLMNRINPSQEKQISLF